MDEGSKRKSAKIAVCCYQNRVCPRFDATPEILIYDINPSTKEPIEKLDVSQVSPETILKRLAERDVGVVITGGIQERFQQMFLRRNTDLIWGVTGEVQDVLQAYLRSTLHSGMRIPTGHDKRAPSPVSGRQKVFLQEGRRHL